MPKPADLSRPADPDGAAGRGAKRRGCRIVSTAFSMPPIAARSARWRELALAEIAASLDARRLPILVGGTGLYLRALRKGWRRCPPIPAAIRAEARRAVRRARRRGVPRATGRARSRSARRGCRPATAASDPRLRGGARDRPPLGAWQDAATGGAGAVSLRDDPAMPPRDGALRRLRRPLRGDDRRTAGSTRRRRCWPRPRSDLPAMKAVGVPELCAPSARRDRPRRGDRRWRSRRRGATPSAK